MNMAEEEIDWSVEIYFIVLYKFWEMSSYGAEIIIFIE